MNNCSPKRNQELIKNQKSCYNNIELKVIAKAYNDSIKKHGHICNNLEKKCTKLNLVNLSNDTDRLYKDLSNNLSSLTKREENWLSLDFINNIKDSNLRDSLLNFTFKPIGPKKDNDWLNTTNINEVEQQYLDLYKSKNFTFLGAQPSDYTTLIKINWKKLKNYNLIGIIFNIDTHDKSGTHWVSVFIDNVIKTVDFFDSLGNYPNKHICSFLRHFPQTIYHFNFNLVKHQKGGSQCGVYACFFLNKRLKGYTMDNINKEIISDKMMIAYRKEIFR